MLRTPYFLIDKKALDSNILNFKLALEEIWPNSRISYSVKTNSLPWLLQYLKDQNLMAEVVSDEEYELALLCKFDEGRIVFNGPIKGEKRFIDSINKGSIVNIDSKNEVEIFRNNFKDKQENVGVRVNIDTSIFESNDIGYAEDGFRFGFAEEKGELKEAIDVIRLGNKNNKIGLHFHCNSISRSIDVYRKLAEYAKYVIKKYEIVPSYLDIGGGFFGGVLGKPTAHEYIEAIYDVLKDTVDVENTTLVIEPGSAIIGSAVEFHTSVLDVKDTNKSRIVTTDGSRVNIDPLWSKKMYSHRIEMNNDNREKVQKQTICGYTCMDHDRLMTLFNENSLSVGDKIIYEKVGSYSVTFGGPFIRYLPKVYVKEGNDIILSRNIMVTRDYYEIQSK